MRVPCPSEGPQGLTCPSADQARDVHWGGSALLLVLITSCFSSSTMIFPSRSCGTREVRDDPVPPGSHPDPTRARAGSETASGFPHGVVGGIRVFHHSTRGTRPPFLGRSHNPRGHSQEFRTQILMLGPVAAQSQ